MFAFIILFGAFAFTLGADLQESGDIDRIKKEIKEITIVKGNAINTIINK